MRGIAATNSKHPTQPQICSAHARADPVCNGSACQAAAISPCTCCTCPDVGVYEPYMTSRLSGMNVSERHQMQAAAKTMRLGLHDAESSPMRTEMAAVMSAAAPACQGTSRRVIQFKRTTRRFFATAGWHHAAEKKSNRIALEKYLQARADDNQEYAPDDGIIVRASRFFFSCKVETCRQISSPS